MIATKGEANSIVASSNPKAIILAKKELKSVTIIDKKSKKSKNLLKIVKVKRDLWVALIKLGIKLCVNAPSAKILRKRFGSLKATKKISLYTLAPKMEAVKVSRRKPKILDTKVPTLFVKNDLINIWNNI